MTSTARIHVLDIKKAPLNAGLRGSLADLRRIAECDREEQSCNRESEDEDVSEAFHRLSPKG